jgi:hypothetical protein
MPSLVGATCGDSRTVIGSGGRPLIAIFSLLLDDQGTQVNWRNAGCAFAASRKMRRQSTCKAYSGNDVHDEYFPQVVVTAPLLPHNH